LVSRKYLLKFVSELLIIVSTFAYSTLMRVTNIFTIIDFFTTFFPLSDYGDLLLYISPSVFSSISNVIAVVRHQLLTIVLASFGLIAILLWLSIVLFSFISRQLRLGYPIVQLAVIHCILWSGLVTCLCTRTSSYDD
jgi:hypothetical protein